MPMAASVAAAAAGMPPFDNASVWHNLTTWTVQHLPFLNMTRITPSLDDIVWAGPRIVRKLGRLGSLISVPDGAGVVDNLDLGPGGAGTVLFQGGGPGSPEAMATDAIAAAAAAAAAAASASAAGVAAAADPAGIAAAALAEEGLFGFFSWLTYSVTYEFARGFCGLFAYATSKWALGCLAIALVLNRTYIFAATRARVRLHWQARLILRAVPILMFLFQARRLLQSIQCQTSPDFAVLRWGPAATAAHRHEQQPVLLPDDLLFSNTYPILHGLSAGLLLGATDEASCRAVRMIPPPPPADGITEPPADHLRGSLARLWPFFLTLCSSTFVETLSCAVQGRQVVAETGMTIFEHSLAFAEADAAIVRQLGWSTELIDAIPPPAYFFSNATFPAQPTPPVPTTAARAAILRRVNAPPEVLLLAFLSAMSHVTSHVLGVLNMQARFRLLSTGFWALCIIASIVYSALTFSVDDPAGQSLLRFPTVSIVGFIPHMLVLAGIVVCGTIYGLALLLCAASPAPDRFAGSHVQRLSFFARLRHAHDNMQANLPTMGSGLLHINMEMNFHAALMRTGIAAVTMASEAVYLTEDRRVNLRPHTWLEDERYAELRAWRTRWLGADANGASFDYSGGSGGGGGSSGAEKPPGWYAATGYARERAVLQHGHDHHHAHRASTGASERAGRWLLVVDYLIHVAKLVLAFAAVYVHRLLGWAGLRNRRPRWILRLLRRHGQKSAGLGTGGSGVGSSGQRAGNEDADEGGDDTGSEWLVGRTGRVPIRRNDQVDVEGEMRRRLFASGRELRDPTTAEATTEPRATRREEREIDRRLYQWWLQGGWWGEVDTSGDYVPPHTTGDVDDDDTTSVLSLFDDDETDASESAWSDADGGEDDDGLDSIDFDDFADHLDDGQRTPTQDAPWIARPASPGATRDDDDDLLPLDLPALARLLDPRTPDARAEAQALAAHLAHNAGGSGVLTRAAYARFRQRQRLAVLSSSASLPQQRQDHHRQANTPLSPDEEAQLLEDLLLSKRGSSAAAANNNNDDATTGLGPDGPQCVVCQSAARTILVWPCRCLSLCDDCRVSLAMNNFDKCVCCRREVVSFSRIYVP